MTANSSKRITYAVLLAATIALGLFSRSHFIPESSSFGTYAGDTLWSLAVFWTLAIIAPRIKTQWLLVAALLISLTVELSQLYHAEWIDRIRANKLAALFLGNTFIWTDLACYTAGAFLGAIVDYQLVRKERQSAWNWWLTSTIKDRFLVFGTLGICVNGILLTMNMIELKTLSIGVVFLFIGFMMKSEDSTNI